jgi:hypothetical protein
MKPNAVWIISGANPLAAQAAAVAIFHLLLKKTRSISHENLLNYRKSGNLCQCGQKALRGGKARVVFASFPAEA